MTVFEKKHYEVQADAFWANACMYGSGYDVMERAQNKGWKVISAWGADGWDLGSWPYVMIYFRTTKHEGKESFDLVYYVEGDITQYHCPTREDREQITDELAFWHWHNDDEEWVRGYETVDQLPPALRGPFRHDRYDEPETV